MISRTFSRSLLALAAAAMSLTAITGAAQAEAPEVRESGGHWMLQRHDADGDGMISLQEFQAAGDEMFARMDTDGAGRISVEDFAARRDAERTGQRPGPRLHRGFARMDADGDGFVTKAEFDEARMTRFNALDANGNGVIDADEVPARKGGRKGHGKRYYKRGSTDL